LPLANLSSDPAREYFSDGMTDELITDLALAVLVGNLFSMRTWQTENTQLQWLDWGFQHHCDGLQFLKAEPIYENLQDDPKFKKLITQLRL
jgi:hypothetical protein